MSRLARQIRECMSDLGQADDGNLTARFVFPAEFLGFQGHFPARPVLPAVCEIQAALAMLEAWETRRVDLREIILAKFSAPVTCDEEAGVRVLRDQQGSPWRRGQGDRFERWRGCRQVQAEGGLRRRDRGALMRVRRKKAGYFERGEGAPAPLVMRAKTAGAFQRGRRHGHRLVRKVPRVLRGGVRGVGETSADFRTGSLPRPISARPSLNFTSTITGLWFWMKNSWSRSP